MFDGWSFHLFMFWWMIIPSVQVLMNDYSICSGFDGWSFHLFRFCWMIIPSVQSLPVWYSHHTQTHTRLLASYFSSFCQFQRLVCYMAAANISLFNISKSKHSIVHIVFQPSKSSKHILTSFYNINLNT